MITETFTISSEKSPDYLDSNMNCKTSHIEALLNELSRKTNQPLDLKGFERMSEEIGDGITPRYLYNALHRKKESAKQAKIETINLQPLKLDKLVHFLGAKDFRQFVRKLENPTDPVLYGLIGNYKCYIRRNTENTAIFSSPVNVREDDGKIKWMLKGPGQMYEGTMEFVNGCVFVLMKASNGKQFHHVYTIGKSLKPQVIQGIFSGVSTAFVPIGGRVLLVRTEEKFESLINKELTIKDLQKSKDLDQRRIAEYLGDYATNNLRISHTTTFTIDDLGVCD